MNHYLTALYTPRTTNITTTRLLLECKLYLPNYDSDPQMKKVMQQFDEAMVKNRQKCKDKCDKEIQKIILKDKMEKELIHKFATLQKDIQSDAIPTCICEKSLAYKVEKTCLICGYGLGSVTPSVGLFGTLAVNK
nr:rifin PIR protein,putative [Plasmodium sp. DRC-Itaito]